MNKRNQTTERGSDRTNERERDSKEVVKRGRKLSEYGKQLQEKQKVRDMYGMREKQFKRFFATATRSQEATGESLLNMLERRLDNVLFRLKLAATRPQARQLVVHGLVKVNGKKVYSPSYQVIISDEISLANKALNKEKFVEQVVNKKLNTAAKVPEWLELDKSNKTGKVLRLPVRADIHAPIEEHLIVELYSK